MLQLHCRHNIHWEDSAMEVRHCRSFYTFPFGFAQTSLSRERSALSAMDRKESSSFWMSRWIEWSQGYHVVLHWTECIRSHRISSWYSNAYASIDSHSQSVSRLAHAAFNGSDTDPNENREIEENRYNRREKLCALLTRSLGNIPAYSLAVKSSSQHGITMMTGRNATCLEALSAWFSIAYCQ